MPIIFFILLIILIAQLGFWKTFAAVIGAVAMIVLLIITAIATLDLRVDYVRPAREQASVFGRAQCYRLTRSAAFVRGLAHDGDADDPVAHIQAVFMKITSTARL